MFKTKNNYFGGQFDYENESGSCVAHGDFRFTESSIESVNVQGVYMTEDPHDFVAQRNSQGNTSIYNVNNLDVLENIAKEVALIIAEVENLAPSSNETNEDWL